MFAKSAKAISALFLGLTACAQPQDEQAAAPLCDVSLLVLGIAQDAGKPQIGNPDDPAWDDPTLKKLPTSLALIDRRSETLKRWLFEATPAISSQLQRLDETAPVNRSIGLDGVFITHAHIGHYAGLLMFGHEAAGAENVTVYAMPRMADFLAQNGPWSQLVRYHNIILAIMSEGEPEQIAVDISVTPFLVPHRQEFSEVVGFHIQGPDKTALFIPDIDSWEDWDADGAKIEDVIEGADIAYLDATFFADGEIPGRDMSGFPHPFVSHSMERFEPLPDAEKAKIRFIHMNHTNPLLTPNAAERESVVKAGFNIAEEGETVCL
ncbi:MAG: MBL fold metallo-hydrolase [Pseudomonadota bacterium]